MPQLEDEIRTLIEDRIRKDNEYMSNESMNNAVNWRMDQIARWIVDEFFKKNDF